MNNYQTCLLENTFPMSWVSQTISSLTTTRAQYDVWQEYFTLTWRAEQTLHCAKEPLDLPLISSLDNTQRNKKHLSMKRVIFWSLLPNGEVGSLHPVPLHSECAVPSGSHKVLFVRLANSKDKRHRDCEGRNKLYVAPLMFTYSLLPTLLVF